MKKLLKILFAQFVLVLNVPSVGSQGIPIKPRKMSDLAKAKKKLFIYQRIYHRTSLVHSNIKDTRDSKLGQYVVNAHNYAKSQLEKTKKEVDRLEAKAKVNYDRMLKLRKAIIQKVGN